MPLALSTSWNAFRYKDARSMLFEIKQIGFSAIELSFNLTKEMVSEIRSISDELGLNITSLHNYCPIPDGLTPEEALPDCYSISSLDSRERDLAVKYTKRTIDTGRLLGAKAVVLHCGRVEIEDKTRELIALYNKGLKNKDSFAGVKDAFISTRSLTAGLFLENAIKSLSEISHYSMEQGILLGIENRFYYREIPSFEEIGIILDKFGDKGVFYWHDTGHAKVMQNLGLLEDQDYLSCYSSRLLGLHLHNVVGCCDHLAPASSGEVKFSDFIPYINKDTLKVIEAHHPATSEDLAKSVELLERSFNGIC